MQGDKKLRADMVKSMIKTNPQQRAKQ